MPSCAETARRLSRHQDGDLSRGELFGMRLHLACCRFCRRYARHLRFLHESMRTYADHLETASRETLSLEARRKIIDRLRSAP